MAIPGMHSIRLFDSARFSWYSTHLPDANTNSWRVEKPIIGVEALLLIMAATVER